MIRALGEEGPQTPEGFPFPVAQEPPHINLHVSGVVIPSWLAVCLLLTAILAAVSLLLGWQEQRALEREIRVLQIHCADIENVLIRQHVATREDFMSRPKKEEE